MVAASKLATRLEKAWTPNERESAVCAAYAWYSTHSRWKKGYATAIEQSHHVPSRTLMNWLTDDTKPRKKTVQFGPTRASIKTVPCKPYERFYDSVEGAVEAVRSLRKGCPPRDDMTLQKALHDHIIFCWEKNWVPPPSYVHAYWLKLQKMEGVQQPTPFTNDRYKNFIERWRLSERMPSDSAARRLAAEKPEVVKAFFDGIDVKHGEQTVHHYGLKEVMSWPCDTRNGANKSFADCLAAGEDRAGNLDESCLTKAAESKDAKGVGPVEAKCFSRCSDGTRESITSVVGGTFGGNLFPRFYIKKGSVWTENHLKYAPKGCKLCLKPDSYMMDGDVFVQVLYALSKELDVSPKYRFLLLVDGHYSRLCPQVQDAAKELGFVLLLFPGSLTHILQPFDQVFGDVKQVYYELMAWARAKHFNNVSLARWISCWEQALAGTLANGEIGKEKIKEAFAKCGIWPVCPDKPVNRLNVRHELRVTKSGEHQDRIPQVPLPDRLKAIIEKLPTKRKTMANKVLSSDTESDEDEGEKENNSPGTQRVKSRRVEMPRTLGTGGDYDDEKRAKEREGRRLAEEKESRKADKQAKRAAKAAEQAAAQAAKKAARQAAQAAKKAEREAAQAAKKAAREDARASAQPARARRRTLEPSMLENMNKDELEALQAALLLAQAKHTQTATAMEANE